MTRAGPSLRTRRRRRGRRAIKISAASIGLVLKDKWGEGLEAEHRFHPERKWRFDYAWPARKVAVEVEGGIWVQGRHVRPAGFLRDMEKYNAATALGWRVLRCTPDRASLGRLLGDLKGLLDQEVVDAPGGGVRGDG